LSKKSNNKQGIYEEKTLLQKLWRDKGCYLALLPTFAFLFVFTLYPAITGVYRSFFRWKTKNYFSPVFDGIDNYIKLFSDKEFWSSFGILLVFIVWGFINTFFINFPVTYLIYRLKDSKKGKFIQRAFVIPMMVPGMVGTMYWRFFYQHNTGVLDTILTFIGKEDWIKIWLADDRYTLLAMLFKGFPWIGGFGMLIFLAGFLNVDTALEEAARIDRANAWQIFKNIYLPLSIPQIKMMSILGMIGAIQNYGDQIIFTQGRYNTMVPAYAMYKNAFVNGNYGYSTAQGVILFVIILIVTILQQKFIKRADD
jgi:raffinose/stachyose/melibiose transport system permease protein